MAILRRAFTAERFFIAALSLICLCVCYNFVPSLHQSDFVLYSTPLVVSFITIYICQSTPFREVRNVFYWLAFLIFGSLAAFREQRIDDVVYKHMFESIGSLGLTDYFSTSGIEKGYLTINWLLYNFVDTDYNVAQVVICLGSFLLWAWALKSQGVQRMSIHIVLLFLWSHFMFFMMTAGLVRIFIAVPIVFYAVRFIWEENWKKYVLWVVIASLFHLSALSMLLFLLFLFKAEYFYKRWYVFVLISIFIVFGAFFVVGSYLVPLLDERYSGYEVRSLGLSLSSFDTFPVWAMSVFYYYTYKPDSIIEKRRFAIGLTLMSLTIVYGVASSLISLGRLMYYSNLGLVIVASTIFADKRNNLVCYAIKAILIIYAFFYVMYTAFLHPYASEYLFPYRTFF